MVYIALFYYVPEVLFQSRVVGACLSCDHGLDFWRRGISRRATSNTTTLLYHVPVRVVDDRVVAVKPHTGAMSEISLFLVIVVALNPFALNPTQTMTQSALALSQLSPVLTPLLYTRPISLQLRCSR